MAEKKIGKSASWGKCELGEGLVGGRASWGKSQLGDKNLTFGGTIFFQLKLNCFLSIK